MFCQKTTQHNEAKLKDPHYVFHLFQILQQNNFYLMMSAVVEAYQILVSYFLILCDAFKIAKFYFSSAP
jgi:hypothetical protein